MLQDDDFLQEMVDRTYEDIVESGKYSYKAFISTCDEVVDNLFNRKELETEIGL